MDDYHYRAFGSLFFILHQGKLLWLLNAPVIGRWFRRVLRISGESSSVGNRRITRIIPNAIFWWDGPHQAAEFRTHAKFSKRLYYAFRPLWWAMHAWDWCVADRWVPELSFGFSTLTSSPDADPETNTVDGRVQQTYTAGSGVPWATLIADAGNAFNDSTTIEGAVSISSDSGTNVWRFLCRGIFLFNTSALTSSASISSAVKSLYGSSKADNLVIAPTINIYTSNPASSTALAAGDFTSLGSVAQCDTAITYAGWSTAGYNDFTLNATGRGNVSKTGISKFGTRNVNYDVAAVAPAWSASTNSQLNCYQADQTGTANDPKLVVTYGMAFTGEISDALGISDAVVRGVGLGRRISDGVGLSDSTFRVHGSNRIVSDSVGLIDALSKASGHARRITDAVGITDAAIAARSMFRVLSDALGVTDALAFSLSIYINRYISDSINVTDSASRFAIFSREARDTLGVTDDRVIRAAYARFLSEPLGVSDSAFRTEGHFRIASDSLGLSDIASRSLFVLIYRAVTESLGITDTVDRYQSVVRFLSENLGVSDDVSKASAFSRNLMEAIGIVDAASRAVTMIREIADAMGLSDSNLASFVTEGIAYTRIITESLGITDARIQATATIAWLMIALALRRFIYLAVADPFASVSVARSFISLEVADPFASVSVARSFISLEAYRI